ncbi:MAG: glycosyltransferase family 1 protein [Patescibacteria group bacterium]
MIKVGFITSPLHDANAARGVGSYTRRLLERLKVQSSRFNIEILEIKNDHELQTMNYELVHYPYFDLFRHTLPIFNKSKIVVTLHDVIPLEFPDHYPPGLRGRLNLQLQKLALANVERVITVSYASVQAIRKYLLVPHAKLKLVYEAADPMFKKISKPKNKYHLPKKFVLYVGDVNWNKNIPNLVKACEQINYPLVIVGKQATEVEKLDLNHAELRHLQGVDWSAVIRSGFVADEDLVHIYNLATVYCQPSLSEGFGLPVVEALACGTPVACSNTSSLPEIAEDNATYFNPYDVDDMSQAIINAKPPQSKPMFSWEETAKLTLMVYREIL